MGGKLVKGGGGRRGQEKCCQTATALARASARGPDLPELVLLQGLPHLQLRCPTSAAGHSSPCPGDGAGSPAWPPQPSRGTPGPAAPSVTSLRPPPRRCPGGGSLPKRGLRPLWKGETEAEERTWTCPINPHPCQLLVRALCSSTAEWDGLCSRERQPWRRAQVLEPPAPGSG